MITPRRTRLVRVTGLSAFRDTIAGLSLAGEPASRLRRVVLVPTTSAARQLRRTLALHDRQLRGMEAQIGEGAFPLILTRDELYMDLHARLESQPPRLSAYDRDVMMHSAAKDAQKGGHAAGWKRLRPGLIAEMLRFYDQLRRQARNIERFEELVAETLSRDAEYDRGAERLLAQTKFLIAAFRGYESRVRRSGALDEHALRERLVSEPVTEPLREIVVTVTDWIADPAGLYLADFELLTRLPALEAIDLVATETLLGSGFHQRVHEWLPGIEEADAVALRLAPADVSRPTIGVPAADSLVFLHRDREEELIAVARRARQEGRQGDALSALAVVYKRPLPYLYLAREVFSEFGLAYQASDALPLAAEPFSSALDLVFEFVESSFARTALVALLRSPHFSFKDGDQPLSRDAIGVLDRTLSVKRYLGGLERLKDIETAWPVGKDESAHAALRVAVACAEMLAPLATERPASTQYELVLELLQRWEDKDGRDGQEQQEGLVGREAGRPERARQAVHHALTSLASAHAAHDDAPMGIAELAVSARRWIEEHTLAPDTAESGIELLDDQAARYGAFDELAVVGLVEGEWPERPTRNIFYSSSLLASLGWPTEQDRRAAAEMRFLELLASPSIRVTVSTVSLDEEALVEPSTFVEEIPRARLSTTVLAPLEPVHADALGLKWQELRVGRMPADAPQFHGQTGPIRTRQWSVSALETYIGCPFKFFAQHVLQLQEEPDDEEVMDPRRQGQFVHEVFETFFKRWQEDGHQAITPDNISTARALFEDVVEACLIRLPEAEAGLERTRLLGSPAAAGLGEAVFRMEIERGVPVIDRLIERKLKGEFQFETSAGPRRLSISGKADRIDLLADGTFRVIDYKLGWPPNKTRALQLPIYGICAEQQLAGHLGRHWTLGEATYLAFKGPRRVVGLFGNDEERARVLAEAQERLIATVDAVEAGQFPPSPDDIFRCETCSFAAVCRKDYVGDV